MTAPEVPLWATVRLTHAQLQAVADEVDADLLHLKGPALSRELGLARRSSSDADVLVRPDHLNRFLAGLARHGWTLHTDFSEGSSFGHAANYCHPVWTFADVHRHLPGPRASADAVFERLWVHRQPLQIGARDCWVPDLAGQVLMLTLHAARSHGRERPEAWTTSPPERQRAVRSLARALDADVALAAGLGELERFAGHPDHDLWSWWSLPESDERFGEWMARWRSARTFREHAVVAARLASINRTHLRIQLGHAPNTRELAAAYAARLRKGAEAMTARLAQRIRRSDAP